MFTESRFIDGAMHLRQTNQELGNYPRVDISACSLEPAIAEHIRKNRLEQYASAEQIVEWIDGYDPATQVQASIQEGTYGKQLVIVDNYQIPCQQPGKKRIEYGVGIDVPAQIDATTPGIIFSREHWRHGKNRWSVAEQWSWEDRQIDHLKEQLLDIWQQRLGITKNVPHGFQGLGKPFTQNWTIGLNNGIRFDMQGPMGPFQQAGSVDFTEVALAMTHVGRQIPATLGRVMDHGQHIYVHVHAPGQTSPADHLVTLSRVGDSEYVVECNLTRNYKQICNDLRPGEEVPGIGGTGHIYPTLKNHFGLSEDYLLQRLPAVKVVLPNVRESVEPRR